MPGNVVRSLNFWNTLPAPKSYTLKDFLEYIRANRISGGDRREPEKVDSSAGKSYGYRIANGSIHAQVQTL